MYGVMLLSCIQLNNVADDFSHLWAATCAMGEYIGKDKSEEVLQQEVVKVIYNNALPLFRRLIESGRVRITFMNYKEVSA